jgi:hypothetical protein
MRDSKTRVSAPAGGRRRLPPPALPYQAHAQAAAGSRTHPCGALHLAPQRARSRSLSSYP